ncbi:XRE family transcriptional regulator [Streptomyces sp. V2]|uniref:helix-turn-helix domain-containing protein n=1 Tax=Streptomyces TaxID=1883 RepID=UPI0006EB77DB|nr:MULTISPECIES: helix-turn-helix transcriptional regulator [Streptomyces]PWG09015.1 XRE family transcriptional regulator [Streptomyces sp. V2]QZZ26702.1 helix-turn-helix domain-containing protein [Streptomyces sp. ST1015]
MLEETRDFGQELRTRRLAARWSLQQLGLRVHYSKGYLSKVERGLTPPTPELARLCDSELKADGALAALVPRRHTGPSVPVPGNDDEVWLMRLSKDGPSSFQPVTRRGLIAAGAASVLTLHPGAPAPAQEGAETVLDVSRALFDQYRRLGQASGPAGVLPPLIAQIHTLEQFAKQGGTRGRQPLLRLAARYAEYAGWMAQESGDDTAAIWWTDRSVHLADAGADPVLATYAQVRRSLVSLYRGDVTEAADLAVLALHSAAPLRVRGLAAQHLAQARAVAGDHAGCLRSLDQARDLLAADAADPGQPVLGASHVPDVVSMFTGWCLYDLGRAREAAELFDRETARIPPHAYRTRARYGVRRALAHAVAGEIDHACLIAADLLPSVRLVHSATVSADLRRLTRVLRRHARNRSVRDLMPHLPL